MSNSPQIGRHDELLIDSVLFGLEGIEAEEFTKLKDQRNQVNESDEPKVSHEMVAAALDLSFLKIETMPSSLAERIVSQGRAFCASLAAERTTADVGENRGSELTMGSRDSEPPSNSISEKHSPSSGTRWATTDDLENTISDSSVSPREIISWATAAAIAFVAYFVWSTGKAENQVAERKLGVLQSENQLLLRDLTSAQKKAKISKVLTWKRGVWKPSSNTLKKSLSHAFIRDDVSICGKFDTNSSTWIGVVKSQINPCKQCSQLAKKIIE